MVSKQAVFIKKQPYLHLQQARRDRGLGRDCNPPPKIFPKFGLLPIDNEGEKKKVAKKYKLFEIPQKLPGTLLFSTSCNT